MGKTAICIGINYVGTPHELAGCINDAANWGAVLADHGFTVNALIEQAATRFTILSAIGALIAATQSGEIGVITFSGHGTWVPDKDGDEPDGRDEALVPIDMGDDGKNMILDDELHVLFSRIAPGATIVLITDCCHSGTIFRFMLPTQGAIGCKRKVRFLPPSHFIKDQSLFSRMERAFGQVPKRSNAALPGLIHFSGCKDREYSADVEIAGQACGAFSYFAIPAFSAGIRHGQTYVDVWKAIRESLPNWEFEQTPLLTAVPSLKSRPVLT